MTESSILIGAKSSEQSTDVKHTQLAPIYNMALKRFQEMEWPTQSEEEWRRTPIDASTIEQFCNPNKSTTAISATKQKGVTVYRGLAEIQNMPPDLLASLCEQMEARIATANNRFILWPYLFFIDLVVIDIQRNELPADTITLTTTMTGDASFAAPLIFIRTQQETTAHIVHSVNSADDSSHLCVCESITNISDNSRINIVNSYELNINSYQFSNGCARLERDARMRHCAISLGGLLAKIRYDAYLVAPGGEAHLDGIYLGHEDQHHDLHTLQVHDAPNTNSFALYRGVVIDEAHTIYQGFIRVTERATGTDAYLTNNNLLLSDEARSDSIPSLNISTDEVKCSHGSTTGKIDPLQLFYLQSRGMSHDEARAHLVIGFLHEVLQHTPEKMQTYFDKIINGHIATLERTAER